MGSLRFRRSFRIAPGVRLNVNRRSVGVSAGVRGARVSVNSDGRTTRTIGIPGTGLSYRSQTGPRRRSSRRIPVESGGSVVSPVRLLASLWGWISLVAVIVVAMFGAGDAAGTIGAVGVIGYVVLRILRGLLDPLLVWLLHRERPAQHDEPAP